MKNGIVPKMKNVGSRIRNLPPDREVGFDSKVRGPFDERTEYQLIKALRRRINSDSGIQVLWTFIKRNDHSAGFHRLGARAGWKKQQQENQGQRHADLL